MKYALIIALSILLYGCIPTGGGTASPKIKAKVVRITCASTVIQVLDPNFYALGETWIKFGTTETVEHAAKVNNKCEFPDTLHEGDEFYFKKILESEANNNCAVCALWDSPPAKGIWLKVVN